MKTTWSESWESKTDNQLEVIHFTASPCYMIYRLNLPIFLFYLEQTKPAVRATFPIVTNRNHRIELDSWGGMHAEGTSIDRISQSNAIRCIFRGTIRI